MATLFLVFLRLIVFNLRFLIAPLVLRIGPIFAANHSLFFFEKKARSIKATPGIITETIIIQQG